MSTFVHLNVVLVENKIDIAYRQTIISKISIETTLFEKKKHQIVY